MPGRKGGLTKLDPDVARFRDQAARNIAARSKKQRYDDTRVRLRLDIPEWLKDNLAAAAAEEGTSMNQLGSYFLAAALALYHTKDEVRLALLKAKQPSKALRIDFDVVIADGIRNAIDGKK